MESAKCAAEHGNIIKCRKNLGGNEENLAFLLIFKWPLLKPKMFIVGWAKRRPEDLIECRPTFYKVSRVKVTQKKTIKKACFVIAVYILLEIVALLLEQQQQTSMYYTCLFTVNLVYCR